MRSHPALLVSLALTLAGCPGTNARPVDSPRPAIGCLNAVSSTQIGPRILQDVEEGCVVLRFYGRSSLPDPRLQQSIGEGVEFDLHTVNLMPVPCAQLTQPPPDPDGRSATGVEGQLSLERVADSIYLNASFDVVQWDDGLDTPVPVRIEQMDLSDREGWIECALF